MKELPEVSILIITRNRRSLLKETLKAIWALDYPDDRLEVVVVEETDHPERIEGVRYIPIPVANRGYAYARNVAVKNSTKEFIAFLDDDCIPAKKWLRELVSCFSEHVGGVAGSFLVKDSNTIGYCENALGIPGMGLLRIKEAGGNVIPTRSLSTGNCAYRKKAVQEAGNFDETLVCGGEDQDLGLRVSDRNACVFNPRAVVYHRPYGSFTRILKRFVKRGRASIFLEKGMLPGFSLIKNSLSLRLLLVVIILYPAGGLHLLSIAGLYVFYYLFLLHRYAYQYRMNGNIRAVFLTPLVKHCMDLGMELGILSGLFMKILTRSGYRFCVPCHSKNENT